MISKEDLLFLKSGIVEDYHLGLASDEDARKLLGVCQMHVEAESILDLGFESVLNMLKSYQKTPPKRNRQSILNAVNSKSELSKATILEDGMTLDRFVPISSYSSVEEWTQLLKNIQPDDEYENICAKPLFQSKNRELTLVWAKEIVPDEVHTDEIESFFILEGTADCIIGEDVFHMKSGDYMLIPMHVNHKVVITSSTPAKALKSKVSI